MSVQAKELLWEGFMKAYTPFLGAIIFVATVLAVPVVAQQSGSPTKIEAFYGHYKGVGSTREGSRRGFPVRNRDLDVTIKAAGTGGFALTSAVVTRMGILSGRTKRKASKLVFIPTGTPELWRAESSKPIRDGGPTIMARLSANALTVHVLAFSRHGALVTAMYRRELSRDGLFLIFRRTRNGRLTRSVFASLQRAK